MIKLLFNIILIFLYYLVCICVYIIYNNRKNKKIYIKSKPIKVEVRNIINVELDNLKNGNELNPKNLDLILNKINSKKYQKEIIKVLLNYKDRENMIKFINHTNLLQSVLNKKDKDEYDKSYKIYLIGEFNNQNYYNYLVRSCDDESVFTQINALKTLAKLGNEKYFMKGLFIITKSSSLVHEKVISDNIYSISKKNNNINIVLESKINTANDDFKKIIINHFSSIKYSEAKKEIFKLLRDENTETEVKISCIKYFSVIKYEQSRDLLLHLLNDDMWEVRAMSATALKKYKSKEVVSKLKESINDPVWYVRQNCARSLNKLVENDNELMSIINGEDQYAADAIKSILFETDNKNFEFITNKDIANKLDELLHQKEEKTDEGQLVGIV